jgi:membrane fusion protein, copper/silver efflux system
MNRPQWIAAAFLIVLVAGISACGGQAPTPPVETPLEHAERHLDPSYVCPMHPQVTSDAPGSCPICGMDLVLVRPAATAPEEEAGTVMLSPAMVNNLGVRIAQVRRASPVDAVETVGVVAYDERGRVELRVRAEGYVERLAVRAEGESVRRGQALFAVFSPRLAAAQREFLHAVTLGDAALSDAAADRLRALGLEAAAIERLRSTGQVTERVTYTAPVDGVVVELGIRQGSLAEPGMSAVTIAAVDRLWVIAAVPEAAAGGVRAGSDATLSFAALPGERFFAQVLEVLPALDPATRTLQARIALANPGGRLAAGMRANVLFSGTASDPVLLVPTEAVIRTGRTERVILALGAGRFAPREVVTGRESGDEVEVRAGLAAGDEVVVSGLFMIDSESQVRQSLQRLGDSTPDDSIQQHGSH